MKEALGQIQALLNEARQRANAGDLRAGIEHAERARGLAADLDDGVNMAIEARAAAASELALLLQRAGDPRRALDAYLEAEDDLRRLRATNSSPHLGVVLATTLINLSGLYLKQRLLSAADAAVDEGLTLLEAATLDGPALGVLTIGALQNRASIALERGDGAAARLALERSLALGEELVVGAPELLPQLVDVSSRLAQLLRGQSAAEDGLVVAEKAARWAEAAFEEGSPSGLGLFVATRLQLVDANFAVGRYAEAESNLWKAIDVAKTPQPMLLGAGFYCALLRLSDERMSAGDLPREEVEEALEELIERMGDAEAPEALLRLVRARFAVLARGRDDLARAALAGVGAEASPAEQELARALRADLEWRRSRDEEAG